jgi:hypothetical protein
MKTWPGSQFSSSPEEVTPFQRQDLLARLREHVGERPAACLRSYDDHVIALGHTATPRLAPRALSQYEESVTIYPFFPGESGPG